ncbi:spondin domain-containing protein [Teredinibacter purpureus]|uniref:spondin domain-containing protein n=1 Tax=Teredinibacter purpureus TaxID=2731756 RepID=UPI0005F79857|nr:spondin domain-containing protein [Teredinibacter purpureus]
MKITPVLFGSLISLMATTASAEMISVEITNLTQSMYFTPLMVTSHTDTADVFDVGMTASIELQAMAEGGDLAGLTTLLDSVGAASMANPAGGLLAPASSTSVMNLDTGDNNLLSIVAMLLPTNDGFVGLDAWPIPATAGTYTIMLNGYDAGTEVNDERVVADSGMPGVVGIPANPGGNGGTGGTGVAMTEANTTVHIHRGNLGDNQLTGGSSDLVSSVHRWLNPVAKVVVTVQ